jgi:methylmalonyl-CoA/ethylmalonyl-CoA epimerase
MVNDWQFDHIALIVRDIDKTMKHFKSMGAVVTRPAKDSGWDDEHIEELRFYGKKPATAIKLRWGQVKLGPLTIEFHQPVEGDSPWMEYLEKHGEGIDHICYTVDNVEKEMDKMVKKGFPVILTVKDPGGFLADVYYDTRKTGNVIISTMKKGLL